MKYEIISAYCIIILKNVFFALHVIEQAGCMGLNILDKKANSEGNQIYEKTHYFLLHMDTCLRVLFSTLSAPRTEFFYTEISEVVLGSAEAAFQGWRSEL